MKPLHCFMKNFCINVTHEKKINSTDVVKVRHPRSKNVIIGKCERKDAMLCSALAKDISQKEHLYLAAV